MLNSLVSKMVFIAIILKPRINKIKATYLVLSSFLKARYAASNTKGRQEAKEGVKGRKQEYRKLDKIINSKKILKITNIKKTVLNIILKKLFSLKY